MKYFVVMVPKPKYANTHRTYAYQHDDRKEAIKDHIRRMEMYEQEYDIYLTMEIDG